MARAEYHKVDVISEIRLTAEEGAEQEGGKGLDQEVHLFQLLILFNQKIGERNRKRGGGGKG